MEAEALAKWQAMYGSLFEGLKIAAVDTIYWPIHRKTLVAHLRQTIGLDALEEGLLRLVESGLTCSDELAILLGCSRKYLETMAKYLMEGATPCLAVRQETWLPTPATKTAIAAGQRTVLVPEERDLIRDGLFGLWLSYGESNFKLLENPTQAISPSRLLGALIKPDVAGNELTELCRKALSTFEKEVHSYESPRSAGLAWVELRLLLFQSEDKMAGRILLLNPESDDQPLESLSFQFERLLRDDTVPLYFPDDPLETGAAYWESLRTPLTGFSIRKKLSVLESDVYKTRQELETIKAEQTKTEQDLDFRRRFTRHLEVAQHTSSGDALIATLNAVTELLRWLLTRASLPTETSTPQQMLETLSTTKQLANDHRLRLSEIIRTLEESINSSDMSGTDQKITVDRLVLLLGSISAELGLTTVESNETEQDEKHTRGFEEAIAKSDAERQRLLNELAEIPSTELIEARNHPHVLAQAIKEAEHTLIVISPWIKMRVLRPLLPAIDALLARGCEMWIGYGMPKNPRYEDKTDPEALEALTERQQAGKLHLVYLSTHEKTLIVDDRMFVTSSWNWFGYTGGDGRRETGVVLRGRLANYRDRFLADMRGKSEEIAVCQ
jgi:hypothetical protein